MRIGPIVDASPDRAGPAFTMEGIPMKPTLCNYLPDAIGMHESFANLVADQLIQKGFKRHDLKVRWSAHHDSYVVAVQTARWPKFVQMVEWVS